MKKLTAAIIGLSLVAGSALSAFYPEENVDTRVQTSC